MYVKTVSYTYTHDAADDRGPQGKVRDSRDGNGVILYYYYVHLYIHHAVPGSVDRKTRVRPIGRIIYYINILCVHNVHRLIAVKSRLRAS